MEPYPGPNSIIVMDNCPIHKHWDIVDTITVRWVFFFAQNHDDRANDLPAACAANSFLRTHPTSTQLSFITYSVMVTMSKWTQMSKLDVYLTLLQAIYLITPEDAYGWYQHCGYVRQ